jgi:hypothetical protein
MMHIRSFFLIFLIYSLAMFFTQPTSVLSGDVEIEVEHGDGHVSQLKEAQVAASLITFHRSTSEPASNDRQNLGLVATGLHECQLSIIKVLASQTQSDIPGSLFQ